MARETYTQARERMLSHLESVGWDVHRTPTYAAAPLKIPYAITPRGGRVSFHPQAVHLGAHSLWLDIRDLTGAGLVEAVEGKEGVRRRAPEPPAPVAPRSALDRRKKRRAKGHRGKGRHKLRAKLAGRRAKAPAARSVGVIEDFDAKRAARLDRMKARAERLERASSGSYARFKEIGSHIPMGQPILVGHHSEKRHRRDLDRMDRLMRQSVEAKRAAEGLERRIAASEAGRGGISSDDPAAVVLLREKLAEAERRHGRLTQANKLLRDPNAKTSDLRALLDWMPDPVGTVAVWRSMGHKGIPPTNSAAEIRRIKTRIAELETRRAAPAKAGETFGDVRIEENANRVQVFFPGKPAELVRRKLKGAGFRWAPSEGAWQRMASPGAWYDARRISGATLDEAFSAAGIPGEVASVPAEPRRAPVGALARRRKSKGAKPKGHRGKGRHGLRGKLAAKRRAERAARVEARLADMRAELAAPVPRKRKTSAEKRTVEMFAAEETSPAVGAGQGLLFSRKT